MSGNTSAHSRSVKAWQTTWRTIDARRAALGWSKRELYEATGVSESTYSKMRRDGTPLDSNHKRARAAIALGWTADSIDRILSGDEPALANTASDPSAPRVASPPELLDAVARVADQLQVVDEKIDALRDLAVQVLESFAQDAASRAPLSPAQSTEKHQRRS